MKTRLINFGSGVITGVLVVVLFSASTSREKSELNPTVETKAPESAGFHLVPLKEFFQNVANYRDQHAKLVRKKLRKLDERKWPSRMFIYNVSVLREFLDLIEAQGTQAQLTTDELAIRFYYAVYPKVKNIAGHDYGSLHTLYMVPNHWSEADQKYKDLDIMGLAAYAKDEAKYKEMKDTAIRRFYLENLYQRQPQAETLMLDASAVPYSGPLPSRSGSRVPFAAAVINQGQLCPPNCPTNSLLDYVDDNF